MLDGLCLLASLKLYPDFRYRENLPQGNDAYQALAKADEALGGAIPLRVLVESVGGERIASEAGLAALADVESLLAAEPGVAGTLSLLDVLRSLPGSGGAPGDPLAAARFLPLVPPAAKARLLGMGGDGGACECEC